MIHLLKLSEKNAKKTVICDSSTGYKYRDLNKQKRKYL